MVPFLTFKESLPTKEAKAPGSVIFVYFPFIGFEYVHVYHSQVYNQPVPNRVGWLNHIVY